MKKIENNRMFLYCVLCILTLAVSLFPVSCNYIMNGGIVGEWIDRVEEISEGFRMGKLYLFPSVEIITGSVNNENGMNSNLWFLLPGFLLYLSGNIVFAYRFFMLILQAVTLLTAQLYFRSFFTGEDSDVPAFFGILLYMTCPYRIYICYDRANLSLTVVWMLLPLYVWAVRGILTDCKRKRSEIIASLVLAGIGYADVVSFLTVIGLTLLLGIFRKKMWLCLSAVLGGIFFLPGLNRLVRYLFLDQLSELGLPIQSIAGKGYRIGHFFSSYAYREEHPGLGLGMIVCLLVGVWMWFVRGNKQERKECRSYLLLSSILLLFATRYFPWSIVQRMGNWSMKLVSLIETPAVFFGMASACLSIVGADAVGRFYRREEKVTTVAVTVMVLLACFGICIYQCNTLTYNRLPLTPIQ